jgi:hypothetical protein
MVKPAKKYRNLTNQEIQELVKNHCLAEDWNRVLVVDGFRTENVRAVMFSGDVKLGRFSAKVSLPGGVEAPSGVMYAGLHNCTVGDNVMIRNVGRHIANYDIADRAVIHDVSLIVTTGESSFGNGVEVATVNENGGREVPIYDRLSCQVAYLLAFYRHRPELIAALKREIGKYVASVTSARGSIGECAKIVGCGSLTNVRVGAHAEISGATRLVNGTVNSSAVAPSRIGDGVIAENFVTADGAVVDGASIITNCFVGQGTLLNHQFSASNTLFFANSEGYYGEACSVFAGPYTVTHHKSTLLIAGLFSFYNAGSGTNQSNHMYKLGCLHQGILERGGKTGSSSYLLWPCRIGAFSTVIGKHGSKFDASDFPFSNVMEYEGKSVLIPGLNFTSSGTRRDGDKWPARDRRKGGELLDRINFDTLNPFVVGRMIAGRDILRRLDEETPALQEEVDHRGVKILRSRFKKGLQLYNCGIRLYLGAVIAARVERFLCENPGGNVCEIFRVASIKGAGTWIDACGMLLPKKCMDELLDEIETGGLSGIDMIEGRMTELHGKYRELEWDWVVAAWLEETGNPLAEIGVGEVAQAVQDWRDLTDERNSLTLEDAKKEFDLSARIGFGIDGAEAVADDFAAVRGDFDHNEFVKIIRAEAGQVRERATNILAQLGVPDA